MKKKTEPEQHLEIIIPEEVQALAVKVPEQRKEEITALLHNVFKQVAEAGAEIEMIQVNSIADTKQMALAKEMRLEVKRLRLEATKTLNVQRQEVQNAMSGYQLEDKLLLKTIQILEIQCKAIEEQAEYKEKYLERYAAEQKLKRDMERLEKARQYKEDVTVEVVEAMTDELFSFFLSSLEKEHEAKVEAERKAREQEELKAKQEALHKERFTSLKIYGQFFDLDTYFGEMTEDRFVAFTKELEKKKAAYDAEQEKLRKEAERLAEENKRHKELSTKRTLQLQGLFEFIPPRTDYVEMSEKDFNELKKQAQEAKEKAEAEAKIREQQLAEERKKAQEAARLAEQKAKEQEAENKRLQNELETRRKAEEEKAKAEAAEKEKVAQMSEKSQLTAWVKSFIITIPENLRDNETAKLILATHIKFKNWALKEIEK